MNQIFKNSAFVKFFIKKCKRQVGIVFDFSYKLFVTKVDVNKSKFNIRKFGCTQARISKKRSFKFRLGLPTN